MGGRRLMRIGMICDRIATELRTSAFRTAGLKQSYYPAPNGAFETPAALVFAGLGVDSPMMGEQVWEHEVRVQIMSAPLRSMAAAINSVDQLIEEIWDEFAPNSDAYHLRQSGSDAMVHRCQPTRYEAGQIVNYAGHDYVAVTIYFNVKTHRFHGAA
jgi:hypothetical protein